MKCVVKAMMCQLRSVFVEWLIFYLYEVFKIYTKYTPVSGLVVTVLTSGVHDPVFYSQ